MAPYPSTGRAEQEEGEGAGPVDRGEEVRPGGVHLGGGEGGRGRRGRAPRAGRPDHLRQRARPHQQQPGGGRARPQDGTGKDPGKVGIVNDYQIF